MTVKSKVWNGTDWIQLSGASNKKIVKVDVFDGTYPSMTLTGGMYIGTDGLVCNRTSGNYCTVSNQTVNRHIGDMEIVVRVSLNDWTPSNTQSIISYARSNDFANVCYSLEVTTDGKLYFSRPSTTASRVFTSTVPTGFVDGESKWVRVTFDQNNGSSQSEVKFYISNDSGTVPSSWTQLGATLTSSDIGDGRQVSQELFLGSGYVSALGDYGMNGILRRVIIKNGIDGITTLDSNFSAQVYGTKRFIESSTNNSFITLVSPAVWTAQWSLPAGATFVKVCCVGGGGGGASGRKGASLSARGGGAGGGSGGVSFAEFSASAFTSSVTVTIGAGGTGGASRTSNSTTGNGGGNGNATTFGAFCGAGGGSGGGAGSTGQTNGGAAGAGLYGSIGGAGNATAVGGRSTATLLIAGGAGAGGVNSSDTAFDGGLGTAGLTVGSDVIAVRNFASPTGANGSTTTKIDGVAGTYGAGGSGGNNGNDNVSDSGAGGNGGAGFCVVVSYRDVDVQEFTASGTWNKPVGDYTMAKIFVVGAGGGGGSGRRGATSTNRGGGGGGGGGAITCITVPLSQLGTTETVTIGLGGTGGTAITTNDTNGNPGTAGGQSSLGTIAVAAGGFGGPGGIAASGLVLSGISNGFSFNGGNSGLGANSYTGGGGQGGLFNTGNAANPGNAGGVGAAYTSAVTAATGGANGGASGNPGPNVATTSGFYGGNGGSGSGAGIATSNSGAGGNGSAKGGGGGGSGGVVNGYNSGAGGNGGNGYVCVVCI